MSGALCIRDLRIGQGPRARLEDVALDLEAGDRLGLLGQNGAGKSSLLLAIAGLLTPTAGTIRIDDDDSVAARRHHVGFLPQQVPLYPDLTVLEHLHWCALLQGLDGEKTAAAMDKTLAQVGLEERASTLARQLSAGMQQRLGLAQALLHGPRLLLLDEPTASLDPVQAREVRLLISALPDSVGVIIATHLFDDVTAVCGRVAVLNRGRKIDDRAVAPGMDLMHYFDSAAAATK